MKKKIISAMLSLMTLSQFNVLEVKADTIVKTNISENEQTEDKILSIADIQTRAESFQWNLHTGTALHETDSNWRFLLGDYNRDGVDDIYAINKSKKEIHVLNGGDKFKSFLLHTTTNLGTGVWDFAIGDYNSDGYLDIYAVATSKTSSKTTEIHVLDGKNKYQGYLVQTKTALHETDSNWEFEIGDYDKNGVKDLYAINRTNREVHVLNGANNFQSFLTHVTTALGNQEWDFGLNDYNGDGYLDLYSIAKTNTGSGKTELHILNGSNGFKSYLLQQATPEGLTNSNWEFLVGDGRVNIYGITKSGTSSKTTEVHQFISIGSSENSIGDQIISEAKKHLGKPYVWGASGPDSFDCSGFTKYVFGKVGISLNRVTTEQVKQGIAVSRANLEKGDLIFFNDTYNGENPTHVGIYIGNGQMIHCGSAGVGYADITSSFWNAHYATARRIR